MSMPALLPWIIAIPLASAGVLFLWRDLPERGASILGVGSVTTAAILTGLASLAWMTGTSEVTVPLWTWFEVEGLAPRVALHLDGLSLTMLCVITGVGSLIHLFASWYLHGDAGYQRFFATMNLFVANMLLLVLADDLLALFLGWEGVGLCSYLLVGHYRDNPANGYAARKAFVVTRVGDTAMILGLCLLAHEVGTLNIQTLAEVAPQRLMAGGATANLTAALILAGALGKSAQLPLHTWLPDAMAGPTPVSALIHAATMVTAGVYLIARIHELFELAPLVQEAIGWIGASGLLLAALTALAQRDIKRILAYSTLSQIAYMFMALGSGAYSAAIFHLMTHAFFKALLFLSAGSVIHALHHEQDIFQMGGLRRRMRLTYASFVAGSAALAALPFITSGFYSKDAILLAAWGSGHTTWWVMGTICAFLTGLYAFRLVFIVFHGELRVRGYEDVASSMRGPLAALLLLSLFGAAIPLTAASALPAFHAEHPPAVLIAQILAALAGIGLAWKLFGRGAAGEPATHAWNRLAFAGFGFDALNDRLFVKPWLALCRALRLDSADLAGTAVATLARALHSCVQIPQTGRLRGYAVAVAGGLILVLGASLWP